MALTQVALEKKHGGLFCASEPCGLKAHPQPAQPSSPTFKSTNHRTLLAWVLLWGWRLMSAEGRTKSEG